jgi:ABC-type Fe3+/spermidine/putrescine transport system ATPase subunit
LQKDVGITSIYVTHDQTEALVMSDRVVVINNGVIQQVGDPHTIYAHPANTFVANFIGVANLMEGVLLGRSGAFCDLEIPLGDGRAPLRVKAAGGDGAVAGQRLILSLRPEDISIHLQAPAEAPEGNLFEGEVIDTVYLGNFLECNVRVGCHEIDIQIGHYEQLAQRQKGVSLVPPRPRPVPDRIAPACLSSRQSRNQCACIVVEDFCDLDV